MNENKKVVLTPNIIKSYIPKSIKMGQDDDRMLYLYEPLKLWFIYAPEWHIESCPVCSEISNIYMTDREGSTAELVSDTMEYITRDDTVFWTVKYIKEVYEVLNVPELLN